MLTGFVLFWFYTRRHEDGRQVEIFGVELSLVPRIGETVHFTLTDTGEKISAKVVDVEHFTATDQVVVSAQVNSPLMFDRAKRLRDDPRYSKRPKG